MPAALVLVAMLVIPDASAPPGAPSPEPTTLREIVRVKASPGVCHAIDALVIPIANVVERNDVEFDALRKPLARFAGGGGFDTAGGADGPGSSASRNPGAWLAGDGGDDPNTYTPERTLAASNIDRISGIILHNIDAADRIMKSSWDANPKGVDPSIDAVRQRLQNVVDLQRVLAFRLDDVTGSYFSNWGVASLIAGADRGAFDAALARAMSESVTLETPDAPEPVPPDVPIGDVAAEKREGAAAVARALSVQKHALAIESLRIARACETPIRPAPPPAP